MAHTPNNMPFGPDRSSGEEAEEDSAERDEQRDEDETTSVFQRMADDVRERYRKALDRLAK